MAYLNKVFLMGNLTRDPVMRSLSSGSSVCSFGMAINRQYTNVRKEQKEEVCFVDVDAWNRTAEVICQYCRKGSPIFIEGSLRFDQWDDKTTGQKRNRLTVRCDRMQLIGGTPPQNGGYGAAPQQGGYDNAGGGYPPPQQGGYSQNDYSEAPQQGGYSQNDYPQTAPPQTYQKSATAAPQPAPMPKFNPIQNTQPTPPPASMNAAPAEDEPVDDIPF